MICHNKTIVWPSFWVLLLAAISVALPAVSSAQTMDDAIYTFFQAERSEFSPGLAGDPIVYDITGWIGGDFNRIWTKLEGDHSTTDAGEREFEFQLLYGRLVSPFWDFQVGGVVQRSYTQDEGSTRFLATAGFEGLAPYWFHVETALFLSEDGDLTARFEGSHDLLITQFLVLQPELEMNLSAQDIEEAGVGAGITDLELGAQLRYEIVREFAPYVGFYWNRLLGETAGLARADGGKDSDGSLVFGVRWWR